MKEISGYWNIYECHNCATDFAISQESEQSDDIHCPICDGKVIYTGTDFIER